MHTTFSARALLLALASGAAAAPSSDGDLAPSVAELLAARLDERPGASGGVPGDGELWDLSVREHGDVEPLLAELERLAESEAEPTDRRREARRIRVALMRRRGDLRQALEVLEDVVEEHVSEELPPAAEGLEPSRRSLAPLADRLELAALYDAAGKRDEGLSAYEALLGEIAGTELEAHVRVRVALLAMEQDEARRRELADYAGGRGADPGVRNRCAIVLGLLGRPGEALSLFVVEGEGTSRFEQEIRVAEWALRAELPEKAQSYAWQAWQSARLSRDRHYALAVLVEAHRADGTLGRLIDSFATEPELGAEARDVWIDLLRETGRIDEAVRLFSDSAGERFSVEQRRELLEMYREGGREDVMVAVFRDLVRDEPQEIEWREGLARFLLERGDRQGALSAWDGFAEHDGFGQLVWGAEALEDLGLDELAVACADRSVEIGQAPYPALLFLHRLHRDRGRQDAAEAALARLDALAPPDHAVRYDLSEAYEGLGRLERAVEILEGVRASRPAGEVGEDLEMRLAWLYSEVGDEERALELWRELWSRIAAESRRRYAEDRLMTVASRLGVLADIAIELEERLAEGTAEDRDGSLLVRLYEKVNDPVSAAEVIEEHFARKGTGEVETLKEQARVYLSCNDFYRYEKSVRRLIELDPEGEGDYLRQLAMSHLERGKPDLAREVLSGLQALELGSDSAEFEAGVLALAGLREEAIAAYRRGLVEHPDRIESYLLLANLMREVGRQGQAIGMFQHLAETAGEDDLFTIAIDGLLNLEAPAPVLSWARRVALERIAGREDKAYLYELVADLAEQEGDLEAQLRALEASLAIAGERRPSVLRELMELTSGAGRDPFASQPAPGGERHLAYGRRLIGLAEVVPPQVYLDLGRAFLEHDEPSNAAVTFRLARDLPDHDAFVRQAAALFEEQGYRAEALRWYESVLVARSTDAGLMAKVGELHEQLGRDDLARDLYRRGLDLLLARRPLVHAQEVEAETDDPWARWWAVRNVDDFDQHYERLLEGLLVTAHDAAILEALLAAERDALAADLAAASGSAPEGALLELSRHPRLLRRGQHHRRIALAIRRPDLADELDRRLLAAFPSDESLLEELVRERAAWGYSASARALIESSARSPEERRALSFLAGDAQHAGDALSVRLDEARRLVLPLLVEDRRDEARELLRRVELGGVGAERVQEIGPLFSAALVLGDLDLGLSLARQWARLMLEHEQDSYQVQAVLDRCAAGLGEERGLSLFQYFVGLVLADPAHAASYVAIFPELQKRYGQPLVEPEPVLELLADWDDGGWGWGLGPVLAILPEADRPMALRAVWPSIQKTMRATFLTNLVGELDVPMGAALGEFVVEGFEGALEDADADLAFYFEDLSESVKNADVVVRMAGALLERQPENHAARAVRAVLREELGDVAGGLADALQVFEAVCGRTDAEWYEVSARYKVQEKFLPEHLEAFLSALDRAAELGGAPAEIRAARLSLLARAGDSARQRALLEQAIAEDSEDVGLLSQLRQLELSEGRALAALAALERAAALEPKNAGLRRELHAAYKDLWNPEAALAQLEVLEELGEGEPDALAGLGVSVPAGASVTIVQGSGRVIRIVNGVVVSGGTGEDAPSIEKVKAALDAGDVETARTTLRRLWRQFPVGEGADPYARMRFGGFGVPTWSWPEERSPEDGEETEEQRARRRGGLSAFSEEEPEPPAERRDAYQALAEHAFGLAEIEAMLRIVDARELDWSQPLVEALLHARTASGGADGAREELLAAARAGRAGKVDTALLIALLDADPGSATADTAAILSELLRALSPEDAVGLRRLARAWARQGNVELAARLYEWVATRTTDAGFSVFGGPAGVSTFELVKEVRETLAGAERERVIEAILRFADPGEYPWQREHFEMLAIDTWAELLGPESALERCRAICDAAGDLSRGLRRGTAMKAAWLLSRGGELEAALRGLEVALCKLDASELPSEVRWWSSPEHPGSLSHADLRRLFPRDSADAPRAMAWFRAAAAAIEGWLGEERVSEETALQALAVLCRRLSAGGDAEAARALAERLLSRDGLSTAELLFAIDAARESGAGELAGAAERRLLDERRLAVERVPEVVARALEREGADAALALGTPAAEYTRHPELLAVLAEACARRGDEAGAAAWRAAAEASEAAAEALRAAEREARDSNE